MNIGVPTETVAGETRVALTPETAKKLIISLPTLHSYTQKGILKSYKVGVRVLYKKSEVEGSAIAINYASK